MYLLQVCVIVLCSCQLQAIFLRLLPESTENSTTGASSVHPETRSRRSIGGEHTTAGAVNFISWDLTTHEYRGRRSIELTTTDNSSSSHPTVRIKRHAHSTTEVGNSTHEDSTIRGRRDVSTEAGHQTSTEVYSTPGSIRETTSGPVTGGTEPDFTTDHSRGRRSVNTAVAEQSTVEVASDISTATVNDHSVTPESSTKARGKRSIHPQSTTEQDSTTLDTSTVESRGRRAVSHETTTAETTSSTHESSSIRERRSVQETTTDDYTTSRTTKH